VKNRRLAFIVLGLVAAGLVAAMVVTLRGGSGGSNGEPKIVGKIGPTPGPDSEGHVKARRAFLEALAKEDPDAAAAGLVSFTRYMSAAEAMDVVGGSGTTAVFVKFPGAQEEVLAVEGSLRSTVANRAKELADTTREEIASLEKSGSSAELLNQRRAELGAITPECACAYAVSVQGTTVAKLAELQAKPEVKLVDLPEPLTDELAGWQLTPIAPAMPKP
jgi:hypothetical protein